jgi:hypothetical protein
MTTARGFPTPCTTNLFLLDGGGDTLFLLLFATERYPAKEEREEAHETI